MTRGTASFWSLALVAVLALAARGAIAQDASAPAPELDAAKEIASLQEWKTFLTSEVDKYKQMVVHEQGVVAVHAKRAEELTAATAAAEARATAADAQVTALKADLAAAQAAAAAATAADAQIAALKAELAAAQAAAASASAAGDLAAQVESLKADLAAAQARAEAAEATAAAQSASAVQLQAQVETLKAEAAAAAARSSAAAAAAGVEAAGLRTQLEAAVAERQALEARVEELAAATAQSGGLHGHARAILDILVAQAARHHATALAYANDKLPGLKAKVSEVHAVVSAKLGDLPLREVPGSAVAFVGRLDGELRPWLSEQLGRVPGLEKWAADPVAMQAITLGLIAAPVLLVLTLLFTCCCCMGRRKSSRGGSRASGRKTKKTRTA